MVYCAALFKDFTIEVLFNNNGIMYSGLSYDPLEWIVKGKLAKLDKRCRNYKITGYGVDTDIFKSQPPSKPRQCSYQTSAQCSQSCSRHQGFRRNNQSLSQCPFCGDCQNPKERKGCFRVWRTI